MQLPSRGVSGLGLILVLSLACVASACLKIQESPLQNLGIILAAKVQDAHYRYTNTNLSGGSVTFGIFTSSACSSLDLIGGTGQTVSASGTTSYFAIPPGTYSTGAAGYCAAFSPAEAGSYTIQWSGFGFGSPKIISP